MTTAIVVIVVALAALGIAYWISHTRLVNDRNEVASAWGSIDTELERRHALIPQLIATVQAAAVHERDLLVEVAQRNQQATDAEHTVESANRWEPPLVDAVARVVALRERYPALNSQQNFLEMQRQLALTEDRIAAARRFYNTRVEQYHRRIESFPSAWVAGRHGFDRTQFFGE